MSEKNIGITVNGQSVLCRPGSLLDYLLEAGLDPQKVVAEVNGRILKDPGGHQLEAGDLVEILQFVGGG